MGDLEGELPATGTARARGLTPAEIAWIALTPCAAVAVAAIIVLGPALGHALFRPGADALWPPYWWETQGRPEPTEEARYVLAVLAPFLLAVVILRGVGRAPALPPWAIRVLTLVGQVTALAFVTVAVLGQHNGVDPPRVLSAGTLVATASIVLLAGIVLRCRRVVDGIARLAREATPSRVACLAIASLLSASCALQAVMTDRLVEDGGQLNWTLNDAFAVLDGRTPLVDYHLLYAKLLPYLAALALVVLGKTALVYSATMAVLSGLALLAVYAVFRRLTRSSVLALGLFVPFLALSEYEHPMRMPALWPMRYGGVYLLAWLTVRHVDGASPRHRWILFFAGGLLAINNLEFGMAALLATVAALACVHLRQPARTALWLVRDIVGGALGAVAVVSVLTLLRAGALPSPSLLLEWPRIFGNLGWFSLPMPAVGLHLVLYATFVAAIAVAVVRSSRADDEPLLTGMLAWSGVFGLVAGSYYVGRSEHFKLISIFSAWSFALVPLTVACVRALTARTWRRPMLPQVAVLLGFAFSISSIGQLSLPWRQFDRLATPMPDPSYRVSAERFVRQRTRAGEKVAIMLPESYRIAYELRLRNIAPYGLENAVVTRSQMRTLIDAIRRERVDDIFLPAPGSRLAGEGDTAPEQLEMLTAAGFPLRSREPGLLELRARGRRP